MTFPGGNGQPCDIALLNREDIAQGLRDVKITDYQIFRYGMASNGNMVEEAKNEFAAAKQGLVDTLESKVAGETAEGFDVAEGSVIQVLLVVATAFQVVSSVIQAIMDNVVFK
jgi:hypothetical protein